ncbi:hypothetical protein PR202_ga16561 [Eleusine coracana subsp. coracana]|uniref:Uncharacterized protein n=1 Tax=Eleusine coracana subsp. coracana TaxID=191504 RepID=A0AAV5CN19_ELECO|nr:hypothetical protein PR202_ga16561 [Eleusine coracana subsp. coracana]
MRSEDQDGKGSVGEPATKKQKEKIVVCCDICEGKGFISKAPKRISATALIKVEEEVSAELVKDELHRVLPIKWDWVVRPHGPKAFWFLFLVK